MQVEREMPNEDKEVARNVGDGVCDHVGEWCKSDQNLTLAVVPIALCFSGCTELSKLYRNSRKALFKRER